MRVLLVEDHKPLARALRQGLEEEGFAVDTSHDGLEAAVKGASGGYDAIILDLMLPGKDGLSVLREWRKAGIDDVLDKRVDAAVEEIANETSLWERSRSLFNKDKAKEHLTKAADDYRISHYMGDVARVGKMKLEESMKK